LQIHVYIHIVSLLHNWYLTVVIIVDKYFYYYYTHIYDTISLFVYCYDYYTNRWDFKFFVSAYLAMKFQYNLSSDILIPSKYQG